MRKNNLEKKYEEALKFVKKHGGELTARGYADIATEHYKKNPEELGDLNKERRNRPEGISNDKYEILRSALERLYNLCLDLDMHEDYEPEMRGAKLALQSVRESR